MLHASASMQYIAVTVLMMEYKCGDVHRDDIVMIQHSAAVIMQYIAVTVLMKEYKCGDVHCDDKVISHSIAVIIARLQNQLPGCC